jgi:hypothetical protein
MLREVMAHNRCMILLGLTIGHSLMMPPLLLAETFGTRHDGRIDPTSQLLTMAGVAGVAALLV